MKTTAEMIREAIIASSMNMSEISRLSEVSYNIVRDIRRGRIERTNHEDAERLAKTLGIDLTPEGFAEGKAPQIDMSGIRPAGSGLTDPPETPKNTVDQPVNQMKCARVGDYVQVAGTYDVDGLDELIETLEFYRLQLRKKHGAKVQ